MRIDRLRLITSRKALRDFVGYSEVAIQIANASVSGRLTSTAVIARACHITNSYDGGEWLEKFSQGEALSLNGCTPKGCHRFDSYELGTIVLIKFSIHQKLLE